MNLTHLRRWWFEERCGGGEMVESDSPEPMVPRGEVSVLEKRRWDVFTGGAGDGGGRRLRKCDRD